MRILAMESAAGACSAAVSVDGTVIARRFEPMQRGHAEALVPFVLDAMAEAGLDFADLDLVAVTVGPGAFTGLRVGLATARAMALAADLPIFGATTLEVLARMGGRHGNAPPGGLLAVLDSRRDDVFAQGFDRDGRPTGPPAAGPCSGLAGMVGREPVLVVGDVAERACEALRKAGREAVAAVETPDAAALAILAADDPARASRRPPGPLYLRAPAAKLPPDDGRRGA